MISSKTMLTSVSTMAEPLSRNSGATATRFRQRRQREPVRI